MELLVDNKTFSQVVQNRLDVCKETLIKKNEEYSSEIDRLHNFKVAGRINNTTPEKALWCMFTKHLVSVMDIKDNPARFSKEVLSEKITDSINYFLLLEALMSEHQLSLGKWHSVTDIKPCLCEENGCNRGNNHKKD